MISLVTKGILNAVPIEYVPSPASDIDLTVSHAVGITVNKNVMVNVNKDVDQIISRTIVKNVSKAYELEVC